MNKRTLELSAVRTLPESAGAPARVLIVEDDDALRRSLVRSLGERFDVTDAADGSTAAELLVRDTYDAVLSDIGLPGMSGIDLLRLVRTYDLDVPVILMTGQPSVETAVAAMELGALGYVQKPFEHDALAATLVRATKLARIARAKRRAAVAGIGGSTLAGDRAGLDASLDRALDGLSLVFQPIVERRTKRTAAYEALMRTTEPSTPTPGALLEVATRLDRLPEIGRRVRALAAEAFRSVGDDTLLFVNLHPADLLDPDLYDRSAPLTKIASRVVLEITERAALEDLTETKHRATELRRRGFRLAIDDLGAGYAGLTSFATFEPEIVKVDMTLIQGIATSPVKRHVVESVTRLCRELAMHVVAEGIETTSELASILEIGCDLLQGYLLGRPAPVPTPASHGW